LLDTFRARIGRRELEWVWIDELVERFAETGLAQSDALDKDNIAKFNRLYGEMGKVDRELRARGREARLTPTRLYSHPQAVDAHMTLFNLDNGTFVPD
jgi:Domain of unknown function (DUF2019)